MNKHIAINIFYNREDLCFICENNKYSSVKTHGETRQEALKEMEFIISAIEEKEEKDI